MENRGILLINTSTGGVGLFDVNRRIYSIPVGGRLRINEGSLKDIVDFPASRAILLDKKHPSVKVEGATEEMFFDAGLTDEEIRILVGAPKVEVKPAAVAPTVTPVAEAAEVKEEKLETAEEETEETEAAGEIKPVTYYNWIGNNKLDKIKESLSNPVNVETLKGIIEKNKKYNTEEIKNLLAEVE